MEPRHGSAPPGFRREHVFATTHWSVVLTAAGNETDQAQEALEHLCRAYWYPLYVYVRRRGHSPPDAQDLTQAFFTRFLGRDWVNSANPERGRFRTFLLTAMTRFLADEWDKVRALKRGGGVPRVPVQLDSAETRYGAEPTDTLTPEQCYERRWALALLQSVLQRLNDEYETEGRGTLFTGLKDTLLGGRESQPYSDLARQLKVTEGAVRVAVHRLRKRYRQLLRTAIAQTMATTDDVDDELRYLRAVLARR